MMKMKKIAKKKNERKAKNSSNLPAGSVKVYTTCTVLNLNFWYKCGPKVSRVHLRIENNSS